MEMENLHLVNDNTTTTTIVAIIIKITTIITNDAKQDTVIELETMKSGKVKKNYQRCVWRRVVQVVQIITLIAHLQIVTSYL